jgi:hypothetical protein
VKAKTLTYVADSRAIRLGAEMRAVLPKLSARSRHWTSVTLCPSCGDHKDRNAEHCLKCYKRRKKVAKTISATHVPPRPMDLTQGRTWRTGGVGTAQPQPKRPVMVKQADGSWLPEGEA